MAIDQLKFIPQWKWLKMKVNNDFEQEVNKIRLAIHEETNNMNPAELNEYYRKNTEDTIKKYGFKTVAHIKVDAS